MKANHLGYVFSAVAAGLLAVAGYMNFSLAREKRSEHADLRKSAPWKIGGAVASWAGTAVTIFTGNWWASGAAGASAVAMTGEALSDGKKRKAVELQIVQYEEKGRGFIILAFIAGLAFPLLRGFWSLNQ